MFGNTGIQVGYMCHLSLGAGRQTVWATDPNPRPNPIALTLLIPTLTVTIIPINPNPNPNLTLPFGRQTSGRQTSGRQNRLRLGLGLQSVQL